jgi:ribosomal protein L16/L10AE
MLLPKRVKYRRVHRGRMTGKAYRGNKYQTVNTVYRLFSQLGSHPTRSKQPVSQ